VILGCGTALSSNEKQRTKASKINAIEEILIEGEHRFWQREQLFWKMPKSVHVQSE